MNKQPIYSEIIKSFLPGHVANFKAKSKEEAHGIAVAQHKRGQQYRTQQHSDLPEKMQSEMAVEDGLN